MRGHIRKRGNSWAVVVDHDRDSGAYVDPGRQRREHRQLGGSHLNVLYAQLLEDGRCDGAGGLSPRSVRYTHTIVHRALRDAVRWGKLPRNPADMADPPRSRTPEMKTWQTDELRRFLRSVEGDRLYAAWLLVATTGLRRGELLGLRWSDLDFQAGRAAIRQTLSSAGGKVTFSTPKTTKSRRSIAVDSATLATLRHHRDAQDKERVTWEEVYRDLDLVFCREDGTPLRPDTITRRFHDLSRRAGVPVVRLHDVRHTYASIGLAAGTHPKVMAERLGHATVGITLDTYSHVAPALARQAADDIAALILGPEKKGR